MNDNNKTLFPIGTKVVVNRSDEDEIGTVTGHAGNTILVELPAKFDDDDETDDPEIVGCSVNDISLYMPNRPETGGIYEWGKKVG